MRMLESLAYEIKKLTLYLFEIGCPSSLTLNLIFKRMRGNTKDHFCE
jgi:hypothetical protein